MSKFKVGDKVRLVKPDEIDLAEGLCKNQEFIVTEVVNEFVGLNIGMHYNHKVFGRQLELVEGIEEDTVDNLVTQLNKLGYKVILSKE